MNSEWANFASRSRLVALRLWAFPQLLRLGRLTGIGLLSGVIAGLLAGGVGSRIAMRISAVAGGDSISGLVTENGNTVGDITLEGTMILLIAGSVVGFIGGILYPAVRRWLPIPHRWRGLAFGIWLLLVFGRVLIGPENADFSRFDPPFLNVILFASLFIFYGLVVAPLFERFDRAFPTPPYGRATIAVYSILAPMWLFPVTLMLLVLGPPGLLVILLILALALIPNGRLFARSVPTSRYRPQAATIGYMLLAALALFGLHAEKVHVERERMLLVVYPKDDVVDVHNVASQFPVD